MKNIAVIGSTGSIGVQTLNVIRRHPEEFNVISLAGGYNAGLFIRQVEEFKPKIATLATEINRDYVAPKGTEFFSGDKAFTRAIVEGADIVVIALVGFKGIVAVLDAIEKGKTIALANKESLVVGGDLVMRKAKEKGVKILPVDSEHSAIWQSLGFDFNKEFNKIILTASGGAFRDLSEKELAKVTSRDALKHPIWKMGEKITVDCATMVNKAFEVAEARWLYNASFDDIEVIIHRESVIHSMVEYKDGSVIAQMSNPDMELPIQLALSYPDRIKSAVKRLNFAELGKLTFEKVDVKRYPCFELVLNGIKQGGAYPAVINGANEAAVKLFLCDKIPFTGIYSCISSAVNAFKGDYDGSYESLEKANVFGYNFVNAKFGR